MITGRVLLPADPEVIIIEDVHLDLHHRLLILLARMIHHLVVGGTTGEKDGTDGGTVCVIGGTGKVSRLLGLSS